MAYLSYTTHVQGQAIEHFHKEPVPEEWQPLLEHRKESIIAFVARQMVLVSLAGRFYPSQEFKLLPWYQRVFILLVLLVKGVRLQLGEWWNWRNVLALLLLLVVVVYGGIAVVFIIQHS